MPLLPPSAPREARNSFVSALGFLAENAGPRFQNLSELASYQNKRLSPVPVHVFGLSTLAESRPLQMQSSPSRTEIWSFFVTGPEIPAAILEIEVYSLGVSAPFRRFSSRMVWVNSSRVR